MQDTAKPGTRVLIVDDHPVVLSGCRTLFASDHSIRIEEATDAKSGHRAYVSKRPDVAVIDISLPDVSGFELMRRIRKDDPDAKIIMTAALRVLLPTLFGELNLHRVEAACIPTNAPSIRVLEKCGFSREGLARRYLCINGVWQDHLLFGLLHEDFRG